MATAFQPFFYAQQRLNNLRHGGLVAVGRRENSWLGEQQNFSFRRKAEEPAPFAILGCNACLPRSVERGSGQDHDISASACSGQCS